MLKTIFRTPRFKRDYKAMMRKRYDESKFVEALHALMADDHEVLARDWDDHALKGQWKGFRELHIEDDWLLIYRVNRDILELVLTRTGSHDDLF